MEIASEGVWQDEKERKGGRDMGWKRVGAQEGRRVRASLVKSRITEGENRGVCSTEALRLQRRKCWESASSRTIHKILGQNGNLGRILRVLKKIRRGRI